MCLPSCSFPPLQALAEQLSAEVPVAAVDTACLLPMRLVKKCHEK